MIGLVYRGQVSILATAGFFPASIGGSDAEPGPRTRLGRLVCGGERCERQNETNEELHAGATASGSPSSSVRLRSVAPEYPILAHADSGNPDCCGCVSPVNRGEEADIVCNECGAIIQTVLSAELGRTLDEMESQLVVTSEICRHCGFVNLFPGFSRMMAFACHECGKGNAS